MTYWEYLVKHLHIERDGLIGIQEQMNQLGKEGWELIALIPDFSGSADAYFKRPGPAGPSGSA